MTQEEREAVEWVRAIKNSTRPGSDAERHAATAIRLLSRPALPDVNDHAAIDELKARLDADGWAISRAALVKLLTILREPPKPRTKTVWAVHVYHGANNSGGTFGSEDEAIEHARGFLSLPGVKVQILSREVPA